VNAAGGATPGMLAQAVGQGFFTGAVMGSVEAAGQLVGEMLTAANGLSFAGRAQMMGAIEQQSSKLAGLRMGGALTEAISPIGCNANNFLEACFTGEMLLDVEGGKKRAYAIRRGDKLWSRSEFEPEGPLALKEVEEVFVQKARIWNLRVGGQLIRTTGEHPFWVENHFGWKPVRELRAGDWLRTRDGALVSVESVEDTREETTVYNWRIADYHTYFVSATEGDASVWAHNICRAGSSLGGPGKVENVIENMSDVASKYQEQITGLRRGKAYVVDGVKFDGFKNGTLLEAKGLGYESLMNNPGVNNGLANRLLSQAQRQLNAAKGVTIEWHAAEANFSSLR
jgi:hypothetical protein